jgi:hypothetical protein
MDTSLTAKEYEYLYYGQSMQTAYKPMKLNFALAETRKAFEQGKYKRVLRICLDEFNSDPFDLQNLEYMCYASLKREMTDSNKIYLAVYISLMNTILNSGDGRSKETAMVVCRTSDEYRITSFKGLQVTQQALLHDSMLGDFDLLTIAKKQQKVKGQKKYKELYFNISIPFNKAYMGILENVMDAIKEMEDSVQSDSAGGNEMGDDAVDIDDVDTIEDKIPEDVKKPKEPEMALRQNKVRLRNPHGMRMDSVLILTFC